MSGAASGAELPVVDVNLFAFNAEASIGPVIESVLAQTWPAIRLTVIDNASTDATAEIAARYVQEVPGMRLRRARANGGAVVNCRRAFGCGDSDFLLPKTADDLLAPDYVERLMQVLLADPGCAMCHAGALILDGGLRVHGMYPAEHRLQATQDDALERARHVMARYTSAPSFWGVYRRQAVDRLAPFRYRAGWDHAVLAELALYGTIRHVPEPLYWRRGQGKPVIQIARACTEAAQRGLGADDALADPGWLTPLIATAHNHLDVFAVAPLPAAQRARLMADAVAIFRDRWLGGMRQEAEAFRAALPTLLARAAAAPPPQRDWLRAGLAHAAGAVRCVVPELAPEAALIAA